MSMFLISCLSCISNIILIASTGTFHGKGAVDGIGGTVKRNVRMEILSRQEVINSLEEFCKVCMKKEQKIEVIPVSAKDIESCASEIALEKTFDSSKPVNSIKKIHFVTV